ncbi:hypothetical protein BDZ91DRAFT_851981 [Kalaharituber pfeilii]|nr:hypothetical protein BDZ91DRAFT_851981 [Kalaharituber pfeilii]
MARSNIVLSVALSHLLLAFSAIALPLDQCLRVNGLNRFADFLQIYPDPIYNVTGVIVFAPTNDAVDEFFRDPSVGLTGGSIPTMSRRGTTDNAKSKNQGDSYGGSPSEKKRQEFGVPVLPPQGLVIFTGGSTIPEDPIFAKVLKRRGGHFPQVTSGGGNISQILGETITCATSFIRPVDSFFTFAVSFSTTISKLHFDYLEKIFARLPQALNAISCEKRVTFLAPTPAVFAAAGLDAMESDDVVLQTFLDDHTISGFVGYTPSFNDGESYVTKSGRRIMANRRNGTLFLNEMRVLKEDLIISNGVIQILDKIAITQSSAQFRR